MLSESPSTKAWTELAKVCLAQMILFNQRREGEVAKKVIDCGEEEKGTDCEEDGTIQEGHCSSTVEEPSAEMALPSAERNTSPPPKGKQNPLSRCLQEPCYEAALQR
ncbi:hypothetical protein QQF64_018424 [Cirrhinus molitorella]|uniref:Uncharacterized protein n=1 Tax=Cirrhinus molitorella TaxID=172907 RepID=A0ABR3LCT9_9TELE